MKLKQAFSKKISVGDIVSFPSSEFYWTVAEVKENRSKIYKSDICIPIDTDILIKKRKKTLKAFFNSLFI